MSEYVALPSLARELKLSSDTLRNWCKRGLITYSRLPGAVNAMWMVDRISVEEFLKRHEVAASECPAEMVEAPKRLPGRPPRFKAVR
jgi:hypothetical protein